ncbi:MAG TPA: hypothetical protein VGG57_03555 [Stellaceae bacterium]
MLLTLAPSLAGLGSEHLLGDLPFAFHLQKTQVIGEETIVARLLATATGDRGMTDYVLQGLVKRRPSWPAKLRRRMPSSARCSATLNNSTA